MGGFKRRRTAGARRPLAVVGRRLWVSATADPERAETLFQEITASTVRGGGSVLVFGSDFPGRRRRPGVPRPAR